jgi:hypothetical protein
LKDRTQASISRLFLLGSKHNRYSVHNGSKVTNDKAQRRGGAGRVRRIGSIQPRVGIPPSSAAATSAAADVRLVTESPIFSIGKIFAVSRSVREVTSDSEPQKNIGKSERDRILKEMLKARKNSIKRANGQTLLTKVANHSSDWLRSFESRYLVFLDLS